MNKGTSLLIALAVAVGVGLTLWFCADTLASTDHAAAIRAAAAGS